MEPRRQPSKLGVFTTTLAAKIKLINQIIPRNGSTAESVKVRSLFPQLLGKTETQSLETEEIKPVKAPFTQWPSQSNHPG